MLRRQFVEEFQSGEAGFIERVVDVFGEVGADGVLAEGQAGAPLGDEGFDVGEAAVA